MHAGMYAAEAIYRAPQVRRRHVGPLGLPGRRSRTPTSRRTSTARATCARSSRTASSWAACWPTSMEISGGRLLGGHHAHARRRRRRRLHRQAQQALPEARRQADVRQARHRSSRPATPRATTPRTTSGSRRTSRSRSRSCGSTCAPRRSTRCRTRSRSRSEGQRLQKGNGSRRPEGPARRRADHAVELRAVRRHHRQGRAPDAARGRRRPELPADLVDCGLRRCGLRMDRIAACGRRRGHRNPISAIPPQSAICNPQSLK